MYVRIFTYLILIFSLFCNIYAVQTIQINKGNIKPIPIAINNPEARIANEVKIANQLLNIVKNDLSGCGLFKILPKESIIDNQVGVSHMPNFTAWKILNISALLNTSVKMLNNKIIIDFILWDNITGKEIYSGELQGSYINIRKLAHTLSNIIYQKILGEKGYFNSQIAYVDISYVNNKKISRIAIMDYDGENNRFLTNGKNSVSTPRFSKDGTMLTYVMHTKNMPRIYVRNLITNKEIVINSIKAMTTAPRFSYDGTKLLLSVSEDGKTNIVEMDIATQKYRQLTNNQYINTSANYSYDESLIYFSSDSQSKNNIYAMNTNGLLIKSLGNSMGVYFRPAISPTGEYIAATKQENGQFAISIINLHDGSERKLTEGYVVDGASFSPNGRFIAFSKTEMSKIITIKNNKKIKILPEYIYVVDITGNYSYRINTPNYAASPDWSFNLD
ncbi:MAG: Tol-Pal system protein TolB [Rickettsiales bacterium]